MIFAGVTRSFSHNAAMIVAKKGLVALSIAAVDAVTCCAANENSANGSAVLMMPMIR